MCYLADSWGSVNSLWGSKPSGHQNMWRGGLPEVCLWCIRPSEYGKWVYLKSGIPEAVLIPAPECTTRNSHFFIISVRILTLPVSSSGLSNFFYHTVDSGRQKIKETNRPLNIGQKGARTHIHNYNVNRFKTFWLTSEHALLNEHLNWLIVSH